MLDVPLGFVVTRRQVCAAGGGLQGAGQGPVRQQLSEHRALFLRSDLAVGPTLADRRESQDGTSPVHFLRLASPMLQVAAQARRPQLLKIEHLWQRFSAQHRRTMMDEQRYQRRDGALE